MSQINIFKPADVELDKWGENAFGACSILEDTLKELDKVFKNPISHKVGIRLCGNDLQIVPSDENDMGTKDLMSMIVGNVLPLFAHNLGCKELLCEKVELGCVVANSRPITTRQLSG